MGTLKGRRESGARLGERTGETDRREAGKPRPGRWEGAGERTREGNFRRGSEQRPGRERRECGKKRGERTAGKSKKREAKWEGGARRDSSGLWPATPVADSAEKGRRRGRGRLGRQNAQASNFQAN